MLLDDVAEMGGAGEMLQLPNASQSSMGKNNSIKRFDAAFLKCRRLP